MFTDKQRFSDLIKQRLAALEKKELLKIKIRLVKLYLTERARVLKGGNEAEMDKIDDDYQRKLTDINKSMFRLELRVAKNTNRKNKPSPKQ